jgi:Cu/Ag efflux protein CusF
VVIGDGSLAWRRFVTRVSTIVFALAAVVVAACGQQQAAPKTESKPAAAQAETKRYPLKGKIVAIKADTNSLAIDAADIPGFMAAMTMDYAVRSKQSLDGLNAGDEITADVVVPAEGGGIYVENIVVTKKAGA